MTSSVHAAAARPAVGPANPHGHGFIAAMSWKRAGKVVDPAGPGDDHALVLERLAERLEDVPVELGQLVEEEDPVIGPGDLARA